MSGHDVFREIFDEPLSEAAEYNRTAMQADEARRLRYDPVLQNLLLTIQDRAVREALAARDPKDREHNRSIALAIYELRLEIHNRLLGPIIAEHNRQRALNSE